MITAEDTLDCEEFENWAAACAEVDRMAEEHRPGILAAVELEEQAQARLQEHLEAINGLHRSTED